MLLLSSALTEQVFFSYLKDGESCKKTEYSVKVDLTVKRHYLHELKIQFLKKSRIYVIRSVPKYQPIGLGGDFPFFSC